jgi:hypothetical protein
MHWLHAKVRGKNIGQWVLQQLFKGSPFKSRWISVAGSEINVTLKKAFGK